MTNLEAEISSLEKFKILYKNIEEALKTIDKLFVGSEVPVDFITFLENTSQSSSVKTEISPSSVRKIEKDPWPSLIFQLSSSGSFNNFLKFLKKLENSPYLVETQNLNIARIGGEKTATSDINAIFSIKVFVK